MHNNFSNTIKALRKQHHLTQEQIAEALGVSCQAVSKWETNTSCPDISLLPIIAGYFSVSIDYLLGYDNGKQQKEIEDTCLQAEELFKANQYAEAIPFLREALIRHPGNEQLMYKLAWALSGTVRESPDNYTEAIIIYEKILEISTDTHMRTQTIRDLIYRYATIGEIQKALYYANLLPSFDVCREYHLGRSNLLQGKELSSYLQSNIRLFGQALLECLEYFQDDNILSAEEKLPYTKESAQKHIAMLSQLTTMF